MKTRWVISDTHFNHQNILKFTDKHGNHVRPFSSVEEMNETMVERWNSVVKQGDVVYHLGDVTFGDKKEFPALWSRLNGSKRLIVGNHDDIKYMSSGGFFKKVYMWRQFNDLGLLLTHVPVHESTLGERHRFGSTEMWNIHGHIHQNPSPHGTYRCVCVEQTDYTPISLDQIYEETR